ncbi:MAG TPA: NAD(P)/FAD-dependent oxidoreductase [Polyangiaceae bacterium]|nr:NAD(P)/FAD-dependent oxidoreductase [Polyangiaceae bacterium]
MPGDHLVIVGGGLAGLSAGCYGRASGLRTTIVEHNLGLGGVCTAWSRGPYTVDGCIHWLTGGPFDRIYRELGILPDVSVHVLDRFATYRDVESGVTVELGKDIDGFARALAALSPRDEAELLRMVEGARALAVLGPPMDQPPELASFRESVGMLWGMREQLGTLIHFRKPAGTWLEENFTSPVVRRVLGRFAPAEAPALFLLMVLGYLEAGQLSRPDGGTRRFRDALIDRYERLGGETRLHETVDEILVERDRVTGVRLSDGTEIPADWVISTSSAPETVLRLLGGKYGASEVRRRLETWKLFDPIVLASYGVAAPLAHVPSTLVLDHVPRLRIGDRQNDVLRLRVYNDDPSLAPPGHTVIQAILETDYAHWARLGHRYTAEKDAVAETVLRHIETYVPEVKGNVRMTDVATPLTYFHMARSYRGAFEGWMPNGEAFFGHVKKTLPGLAAFYMAGQWVEPGGGVPPALLSGRQAVQILCAEAKREFSSPVAVFD